MKSRHWYHYLWIWSIIYFSLGFVNILFAWLGLINFCLPLLFAIIGGNKLFCNRYCDRGQFCVFSGVRPGYPGAMPCRHFFIVPSFESCSWLFSLPCLAVPSGRPGWLPEVWHRFRMRLCCSGQSAFPGNGPVRQLFLLG